MNVGLGVPGGRGSAPGHLLSGGVVGGPELGLFLTVIVRVSEVSCDCFGRSSGSLSSGDEEWGDGCGFVLSRFGVLGEAFWWGFPDWWGDCGVFLVESSVEGELLSELVLIVPPCSDC